MATPRRTKGKLSAEAQAEVGLPRECVLCGELKEVNHTNYSPKSRGEDSLRGWHVVCRVCQGNKGRTVAETSIDRKTVHGKDTAALVADMYAAAQMNRKDIAIAHGEDLMAKVKEFHDQGKLMESFELFIECVKPIIAGWKEPGLIHMDIKKGLLSPHRRRLIIATRYSAKSTLTGIYVAWRIALDPLIKILVVSRGSKLAARMLRTVRRVIIANVPMLWHLEPTDDCLDNAEQFQSPQALKVVTGGVTLTSVGLTSNLPGLRSDLTIGDDVEGTQEDTPEKVADLEETLNELHMINPRGEKIMLGTYQSEFSIYAKLADLEGADGDPIWELHRALMFNETEVDGKPYIESRWSDMFSDQDGMDWRKSVTARAWRLHAMLVADPTILHERPLKIGDLPVLEWDPRANHWPIRLERTGRTLDALQRWSAPKGDVWHEVIAPDADKAPLVETVLAVDPASGLAGRDAIGVAVLGITQGGMGIIRHLEGVRSNDKSVSRRRVAEIGRDFGCTRCIVEELENGLFGETLEGEFVHVGYPLSVDKVTTGGQQKGRRIIESLGPPMGAGRLVICSDIISTDSGGDFVNQLVRISYDGRTGKSKDHDDIVDALAHAVANCKGSLVSDVGEAVAANRAGQLDRWARTPLRYGGLGGSTEQEYPDTHHVGAGGPELVESLLQEDEVVIALEERRDRLQTVVNEDLQSGRPVDQGMVRRITALTKQITELRQHQVF